MNITCVSKVPYVSNSINNENIVYVPKEKEKTIQLGSKEDINIRNAVLPRLDKYRGIFKEHSKEIINKSLSFKENIQYLRMEYTRKEIVKEVCSKKTVAYICMGSILGGAFGAFAGYLGGAVTTAKTLIGTGIGGTVGCAVRTHQIYLKIKMSDHYKEYKFRKFIKNDTLTKKYKTVFKKFVKSLPNYEKEIKYLTCQVTENFLKLPVSIRGVKEGENKILYDFLALSEWCDYLLNKARDSGIEMKPEFIKKFLKEKDLYMDFHGKRVHYIDKEDLIFEKSVLLKILNFFKGCMKDEFAIIDKYLTSPKDKDEKAILKASIKYFFNIKKDKYVNLLQTEIESVRAPARERYKIGEKLKEINEDYGVVLNEIKSTKTTISKEIDEKNERIRKIEEERDEKIRKIKDEIEKKVRNETKVEVKHIDDHIIEIAKMGI